MTIFSHLLETTSAKPNDEACCFSINFDITFPVITKKKGTDHSINVTETDHTFTPLGKIICGFITEHGESQTIKGFV